MLTLVVCIPTLLLLRPFTQDLLAADKSQFTTEKSVYDSSD